MYREVNRAAPLGRRPGRRLAAALIAVAIAIVLAACFTSRPVPAESTPSVTAEPPAGPEIVDAAAASATGRDASPAAIRAAIRAAIDHPDRPAEDRERDADRRPDEMLAFFGVGPGMKVAELQTGRGYYAELLARTVGSAGVVYAHNSPFVVARFADVPLAERLARPGLEHVVRLDRELEQPGLPAGLDVVMIVLFYHDAYWQGVDRAAMNRAVYDALAPGGVYGVIDHHAEAGSGDRDVKTLHRVDAELVAREVVAAGFELVGESDALRHADDDRTVNVFDAAIRGKTDRFVFKFRKPARDPSRH